MSYLLSRSAERDISDIYLTGLSLFGAAQAERYHLDLERTFAFFAEHPMAARERAELHPPIRAFRYQAHLIVYRMRGADIVIPRVRHGHDDWQHPGE